MKLENTHERIKSLIGEIQDNDTMCKYTKLNLLTKLDLIRDEIPMEIC